jgi:hypothetical protein
MRPSRAFTHVCQLILAILLLVPFLSRSAAAQTPNITTWSVNANVSQGTGECASQNALCNGTVSGTIETTLVPEPQSGTPVGLTANLPTGLPLIPVVTSVNLTVEADYNNNGVMPANGKISLTGGGNFFLGGGTGASNGVFYGNLINGVVGFPTGPGALVSQTVTSNGSATVSIVATTSDFKLASLPAVGSGSAMGIEISFPSAAWTGTAIPVTAPVTVVLTKICGVASVGCAEGTTFPGSTVTGSVTGEPACPLIVSQERFQGPTMNSYVHFQEKDGSTPTILQAAAECGVTHFDWVQTITIPCPGPGVNAIAQNVGGVATALPCGSQIPDPPLGGYFGFSYNGGHPDYPFFYTIAGGLLTALPPHIITLASINLPKTYQTRTGRQFISRIALQMDV